MSFRRERVSYTLSYCRLSDGWDESECASVNSSEDETSVSVIGSKHADLLSLLNLIVCGVVVSLFSLVRSTQRHRTEQASEMLSYRISREMKCERRQQEIGWLNGRFSQDIQPSREEEK